MSSKQKKGLRGSINDDLGDLLGDDDYPAKTPARVSGRGGSLPTRSGKRSLLDDDFFSKLAEEAEKEEASDVSEADPMALLESMKDIEDMDADLFGSKKKPSFAPTQTVTQPSGTGGLNGNLTKPRASPVLDEKKPSSAPANTSRGYKKFSFTEQDEFLGPSPDTKDMDDPLADLLDDTMKSKDSRDPDMERKLPPSSGPASTRKVETSSPAQAPKKREELTFDDDEDDLIDALGFRESPTGKGGKLPHKRESEPPQPARTRLDEILGRGTSPRLLERPPTGEKKDPQPEKTPTAKDFPGEDDFTFGSYQPSMASSPGGRHSRRQSVRFSTEDADSQLPEKKPKPVTPLTSTPTHHSKPAADWLGIKQDDEEEEEEWPLPAEDSLKPLSSPGPSQGSKPLSSSGRSPSGLKTADIATPHPTAPQSPPRAEPSARKEDDDWLVGALSRKKTQATGKSEEKKASQQDSQGLGDEVDLDQFLSKQSPSPAPRRKVEDTPVLSKEPSSPLHRETLRRQSTPPPHSDSVREDRSKPACTLISNSVEPVDPCSNTATLPTPSERVQDSCHTPNKGATSLSMQIGAESQTKLPAQSDAQELGFIMQSSPLNPVPMPSQLEGQTEQASELEFFLPSEPSLQPEPPVIDAYHTPVCPQSRSTFPKAVPLQVQFHSPLYTGAGAAESLLASGYSSSGTLAPSRHIPHPDSLPAMVAFPQTHMLPQMALPFPACPKAPSPPPASAGRASIPTQHSLQDQRAPGCASQAEASLSDLTQAWQSLPSNLSTVLLNTAWSPQQKQVDENTSVVQPQVMLTAESLQQLLLQQQLAQSQLWGLGGVMDTAALHRQRREMEQQPGELALQARIVQLEGQVRTLQLERDQVQMLLESVQQRHKQDTELMESTHRARVKLLEESSAQREARAQQENEDLAERLAAVTRQTEQERADLQVQYQRRLAQTQQDRDREVERLRELQRKSILEIKKDHEEQVQRLKRLKDEEIDAVTSATSQTRSLTVVIEQMEQFSHRLGDLSSRVESTHENTAQGLELGARQRDEQLRVMQDRLSQQQRAMAEERTRLKEVIAKMDMQLGEQQRQLEKERWRVTAEQAKAESAQRSLEEERRALTQHISMEREELERAKSALLEEQQSVMQRCTEERRKLAAEWAQFHTQEKLRQERAEREASRALERDVHREGSIFSMAQEQADLKLRAGELRQREEVAAKERELLGRQQEELEREKERLSGAALRLTTRAQEVERFSKLASEKYEEGERALQEARQVEAEHQARLRSIHAQMERLRQQEQHLHQERIWITTHRREVERLRPGIPVGPQLSPAPVLPDFAPVLVSTQVASPMLASQPPASLSSHGSTELQAKLALLRHTAEKDRDFLQDEQFFLETLKKAPYNSAFHTA